MMNPFYIEFLILISTTCPCEEVTDILIELLGDFCWAIYEIISQTLWTATLSSLNM